MNHSEASTSPRPFDRMGGGIGLKFMVLMMIIMGAFLLPAPVAAQVDDATTLEDGRELTRAFYEGATDSIAAHFTDEVRDGIGGAEGLNQFRSQVITQLGDEVEILDELATTSGEFRVYHRSARFANVGGSIAVVWAFDAEGRIAGFYIRPETSQEEEAPAPSQYLDYETKTELHLPFTDEWIVVWGGRSVAENYHAAYSDQRFAYDLLITREGRSHQGDGSRNEDYYCFGEPILAPGAGVAVAAVDGHPDNRPGVFDDAAPTGNYVVIDHENGEFSFLAHFRENTLRVAPGERVERGQLLGECGNSGRSSEPHLHYHLQNTADFGRGEGLPVTFVRYIADGEAVQKGEPVQGQRIRPLE